PPTYPAAAVVLLDVEREVARYRRDADVQLFHGWARLRAGQQREASVSFQSLLRMDDRSIPAWVSLGIARLEGFDRGGEADLARALNLPATTERDLLFRGAGHLYLLDFPRAARAFAELVERSPCSFPGWFHLALARNYSGDRAAARDALDRAAALQPHDPWVTWLEAELLVAEGRKEDALEILRRRKSQLVGSAATLLRGGGLLLRLGEEARGREWVARALDEPGCGRSLRSLRQGVEPTSRSRADTLPAVEWREGGRVVFPRRAILFSGPLLLAPAPPPE
ncbi:MAG: tetratricopeptide repeat protein, partial [Planctomycetota bacterium]